MSTHAFAICAYGQSPYLEECIASIELQETAADEVFIATSTPSEWLEDIACRHGLPLHVNAESRGIGADWNYAYEQATADYVTIAHQDDVYLPEYATHARAMLDCASDGLIFFSDYAEIRNGETVSDGTLPRVKRRLLAPLAKPSKARSTHARRHALAWGNAICCPAVTFNAANCPTPPFHAGMKSNVDWDTWERLSHMEGAFLYDPQPLMLHRIHEASTTTSLIGDSTRTAEDLAMLKRFWPAPIAHAIACVYTRGEAANDL